MSKRKSNVVRLKDNSEYRYSNGSLRGRGGRNLSADEEEVCGSAFNKQKSWSRWCEFEADVSLRINRSQVVALDAEGYEHNTDDPLVSLSGYKDAYVLTTGNLVGEVVSANQRISVTSRFGDYFLRYLLMDSDGFLPIDGGRVTSSENGVDWMLLFVWAARLRRAYGCGMPKSYVSEKERLPFVRGGLDVVDFAINRVTGRYLCNYRRHSYCNPTTMLITRVFDILGKRTSTMFPDLRLMREDFIQATEGRKANDFQLLATKPLANPLYTDYNSVINFSKSILRRMSGEIGDGLNAASFLFDMSMLFEYYIRKLLIRNGFQMLEKNEQSFLEIPRGLKDEMRKLKPDLVLEGEKGRFVFDVKYKYFSIISGNGGVNRDDLYQLHTYVARYSDETPVAGCGFVYPVKEERWTPDLNFDENKGADAYTNVIEQHGRQIPFHVVFIKIPDERTIREDAATDSFRAYIDRLKKSESDFIELMENVVV